MIERHIRNFTSLRSDTKRSHWTAATKFRAPHKPLLLLAVIDLIAKGIIKTKEAPTGSALDTRHI